MLIILLGLTILNLILLANVISRVKSMNALMLTKVIADHLESKPTLPVSTYRESEYDYVDFEGMEAAMTKDSEKEISELEKERLAVDDVNETYGKISRQYNSPSEAWTEAWRLHGFKKKFSGF